MKTLVVICCVIGMCGSAFGQGLVNFRNTTSTLVSVDGNVVPAGPPALFCFGLFIAPPGTTNPAAFTYTGVYATNWTTAGLIDGGLDRAIPGWAAGESKSYLIREWSADGMGTSTIDPTWFTNCLPDSYSPIATVIAGGFDGSVNWPTPDLFGSGGLPGFNVMGGGAPPVPDTPEFQNLDFEMNCTRGPGPEIFTFDSLLPIWTGYAGTNQIWGATYNSTCTGAHAFPFTDLVIIGRRSAESDMGPSTSFSKRGYWGLLGDIMLPRLRKVASCPPMLGVFS